jgi:hemerythrin-like domain-containing protein
LDRLKITDVLAAEHAAYRTVFDQIEAIWPRVRTLDEARNLASLVEGLLRQHGAKEEDLLYVAFDHVLEDRGQLERMSQEHDELDQNLLRIHEATTVAQARHFLQAACSRAKGHFRFEELEVFPLIERALQVETLERLGREA